MFFKLVVSLSQVVGMFLSTALTRLRDGVPPNIGHSLPMSDLNATDFSSAFDFSLSSATLAGAGVAACHASNPSTAKRPKVPATANQRGIVEVVFMGSIPCESSGGQVTFPASFQRSCSA